MARKKKFYDDFLKIWIDAETYLELKKLAKQQNIPLSVLVRKLIYAELRKARRKATI